MRPFFVQLVALALLLASNLAQAAQSDEFIAGYVSAILEQELKWPAGSYRLRVQEGAATITVLDAKIDAGGASKDARIGQAKARLAQIASLRSVAVLAPARGAAAPVKGFWRGIGERTANALGVSGEADSFPSGDVFKPLLADEKQPQFFVSARHYDTPQGKTTLGLRRNFRPAAHPRHGQ